MDVCVVLSQYLAMVPIAKINWDKKVNFSSVDQTQIYHEVICHQISNKFPPSDHYRKEFLKYIIFQAENRGHEVIDEVYSLFTNLMSGGLKNEDCYKSYNIGRGYVTVRESTSMISQGTTGLVTWQASLAFLEWTISSGFASDFCGRRVLELGCGVGLTGISLCQLCQPSSYVFTDCHEAVLERLRENVHINVHGISNTDVEVRSLDWTEKDSVEEFFDSRDPLDYVLATDVVYDRDITGPLISVLELITKLHPHVTIYVSSTVRNEDTYKHFTDSLAEVNLKCSRKEIKEKLPYLYYDRTFPVDILQITGPG